MVAPMHEASGAVVTDGRRERSRRTRQRIVQAAYHLFAERGYSVPLADVAAAADVSVQNLYVTYRNKQQLVQAVLQLAVHGDDLPIPPHQRPWFQQLLAAPDARQALDLWVTNTLPIYGRVAPLAGMFLSEPDLTELWAVSERLRIEGFRSVMEVTARKGRLRAGVDLTTATDVLFVLLGPVVYQEFVGGRGWSAERWGAWTTDTLYRTLFEPDDGAARPT